VAVERFVSVRRVGKLCVNWSVVLCIYTIFCLFVCLFALSLFGF
jgi:hypothetical protein